MSYKPADDDDECHYKLITITARCYADRGCYGKLSICPSVTLRYRGHIGWSSSKIISRLVSLGCSLSAEPNITDLLQGKQSATLMYTGIAIVKSRVYTLMYPQWLVFYEA